ncbi:MAG: hypothetical protein ACK42H_23735 [Planctomycetota bacterium]
MASELGEVRLLALCDTLGPQLGRFRGSNIGHKRGLLKRAWIETRAHLESTRSEPRAGNPILRLVYAYLPESKQAGNPAESSSDRLELSTENVLTVVHGG